MPSQSENIFGKNIARLYHDKPVKNYRFTGLGDACCVGRRKAVGHIKGIQVSGFPAWLVWRIFMITYLPLWDRRIRTLFDWCIWPFTGRDMASITDHNSLALDERYYETGQDIVTEGDMGNAMYLIRSGEVVVIRKDEDGILATLGPGAHFGEIAVFERCHRTAYCACEISRYTTRNKTQCCTENEISLGLDGLKRLGFQRANKFFPLLIAHLNRLIQ